MQPLNWVTGEEAGASEYSVESTQGVGWMALRRKDGVGWGRFGVRQVKTATHPTDLL